MADIFDAADVFLHGRRNGQLQYRLADRLGGEPVDACAVDKVNDQITISAAHEHHGDDFRKVVLQDMQQVADIVVVEQRIADHDANVVVFQDVQRFLDVGGVVQMVILTECFSDLPSIVFVGIEQQNTGVATGDQFFVLPFKRRQAYRLRRFDLRDFDGLGQRRADFILLPGLVDETKDFGIVDLTDDGRQVGIAGEQQAHGVW